MAATGGTVAARRAGESDATRVTPIPTMRATMTVRAEMMSSMSGRPNPSALISELSPIANNTPPASPRIDAMTPTISASTMEPNWICRALAPSARSSAS